MTAPRFINAEHTIVFCLAFSFESVHPVHVIGLVVTSIDEEGARPQPFICIEEKGDFCGPRASVHKVTVEEVIVLFRGEAVESKEFHQVEVLAYVSN